MTRTEIHALIVDHARWVRARYDPKAGNYKRLLTKAAMAACLVLHGDDRLGVTAMKSAIAKEHWALRKADKARVAEYIQGTLF